MPTKELQHDTLWQVRGPVLTRRRLASFLRKHGFQHEDIHITEHRRSGRNRMFLIEGRDGLSWLAKQNHPFPDTETWFYATAAASFDATPPCLIADPQTDIVVLEYLAEAMPLNHMAQTAPLSAMRRLPHLAPSLARLHRLGTTLPNIPTAQIPFPELDPIDVHSWINSSPAAQTFVADLQKRASLNEVFCQAMKGQGPHGLIHGDLKLDNVLSASERLLIVDWECCGLGALGWDFGAVIGSMIMVWTDRWVRTLRRITEEDDGNLTMDEVFGAARQFMKQYLDHAEAIGLVPPDRQTVITYTAAWIIGRSWSEASFAYRPISYHPIRLLVAETLVRDPAYLFGDLVW